MKLEHESEQKFRKNIISIVKKYPLLNGYKIFFFGSRVSNQGSQYSDIDIGIEGQKPIPAKIFLALKEEINNMPVLYKIDLVDFKRVSDDFRKVALKNIELIY